MSSRLREMAQEIRSCADYIYSNPNNIGGVQQCARDIMEMIDKIASEPLRNCDVGTAEEQKQRFDVFCSRGNCDNCPLAEEGVWANCAIRWSQMPYEKGVEE